MPIFIVKIASLRYDHGMKILAIETSCDDTGISILQEKKGQFKVLSNIVSSQQIHQNYGGVFPMMAKREHQFNLLPAFKKALRESKLLISKPKFLISNKKRGVIEKILEKEQELLPQLIEFLENYEKPKLDILAVTHGPGLEPCLWVGVNFAKSLSFIWDLPIIPVNHIEAHILVNFLPKIDESSKLKVKSSKLFPAICLVVSGGHTQLILMKKIGTYKIIGETRDDAAGECFDKAAKILGLGYPGGPIISQIAARQKKSGIQLPRPMIHSEDYDFSFSGLKTAVLYATREQKHGLTQPYIAKMCTAVQDAIIDVLLKKTFNAAKYYNVKTIILGGGVSANQELRKQFQLKAKKENLGVMIPEKNLSTDNGLMIAIASYFHRKNTTPWQKIKANANLRVSK